MDPFGLENEGYQGQLDGSQSSSNAPGVYPSINGFKCGFPISSKYPDFSETKAGNNIIEPLVAPVLSNARSANVTQHPEIEIGNSHHDLSTMDQGSSELSSELQTDSLYGYPRSSQQDFSASFEQTPMSSLLPSTNLRRLLTYHTRKFPSLISLQKMQSARGPPFGQAKRSVPLRGDWPLLYFLSICQSLQLKTWRIFQMILDTL